MADNARSLLGFSPEIFPVSARLALRAKQGEPAVWAASGFEALEHYIRETLDAPGRVQLKLLNPLGVGAALTDRHATVVRDRRRCSRTTSRRSTKSIGSSRSTSRT